MKILIMKSLVAVLALFGLAGCETPITDTSSVPISQTEPPKIVDILQLRDAYLSVNPQIQVLPLLNSAKDGFIFRADGSVGYAAFRRLNDTLVETSVSDVKGNEVCVSAVGKWTGACLTAVLLPDGIYEVTYKFGNGFGGSYKVAGL